MISIQGTGISSVTYSINGGSEASTPVNSLSIAHGLAEGTTGTVLAYAFDASNARLGVKLSKSFTTPRGYETITLTTKSGSQTITYVGNGTTDVTNTYKSAGGDSWNGGWVLNNGYFAPVTFEYKTLASSGDDSNSYKQIGVNDALNETHGIRVIVILIYITTHITKARLILAVKILPTGVRIMYGIVMILFI